MFRIVLFLLLLTFPKLSIAQQEEQFKNDIKDNTQVLTLQKEFSERNILLFIGMQKSYDMTFELGLGKGKSIITAGNYIQTFILVVQVIVKWYTVIPD